MVYETIPIPIINFADVSERKAQQFYDTYFAGYSLSLFTEVVLRDIQSLIWQQKGKQDKIVIISYLINKLSEKIFKLPSGVDINPFQEVLHFLYRSIEEEGIEIPSDIFSREDYIKADNLLLQINNSLEELKVDSPEHAAALGEVQTQLKTSNKFLWLGKEKWVEMVMGGMIKMGLDKGIFPLITKALILIKTYIVLLISEK